MLCTGRCRWTANKAFQEMTIIWWVTYWALLLIWFWTRVSFIYLQYIHSDSTNKELQRLIICVTHSLSHLSQIAGLSNEPGVPSWWICYRVVLLFMCALCRLFLALYFPSWSAWLGVCTFVMLISGIDAPPRTVGRGRFPAPPRPVKMIKTAGKLRGKIKARISNFSNRGNQYDGTILQQWTMPNPACQ